MLDEIEKAHPDVYNILLQVFEDGQLTDSLGNTIDFKNCHHHHDLQHRRPLPGKARPYGLPHDHRGRRQENRRSDPGEVKRIFNPEFLNRLDEIILFESLNADDLERIVDLLISQVNEVLKQKKIALSLRPDVRKWIVERPATTDPTAPVRCGAPSRSTSKIRFRRL